MAVVQPGGTKPAQPHVDVRLPFLAFALTCYLVSPYLGLTSNDTDPRIAELWPPGGVGAVALSLVWYAGRRWITAVTTFMLVVFVTTALIQGVDVVQASWMALANVGQSALLLGLYASRIRRRSWAPQTQLDVAWLLGATVVSSLLLGVLGGFPGLDAFDLSRVLGWWVLRNTVFCFLGAATFFVLFHGPRHEVLTPTPWSYRTLLATISFLSVYGVYLDVTLPLSWLLLLPGVLGGLTLTVRGTAYLMLTVSLSAAAMTFIPANRFGYTGFLPAASIVDLLVIVGAALTLVLTLLRDQRGRLILELDRRAADAESSRELLEAVFDSMSDGVVVLKDRQVTRSNPAARQLVGRLPAPVESAGAADADWVASLGLRTPEGQEVDASMLREALRAASATPDQPGAPSGVEVVVDHGGSSRLLEVSSRPVGGQDERSAMVLLHDVTAQRARLRELSDFAWMVAHDLRGPLTVLDGWLEILEDRHDEYDERAKADAVVRAADSSRRMGQVIEDWLGYAVVQHGQLRLDRVSLSSVASEIVANRIAHPVDGERPEFSIDLTHSVQADAGLVRQLLDNIVGNAIKYTPSDRVPQVTIRSQAADEPGWVQVEVADRGIGIPEGQEEDIFEEFHRGQDAGRTASTGLGLALTRRIVALHGGRMSARRNCDVGSTFTFTLPHA